MAKHLAKKSEKRARKKIEFNRKFVKFSGALKVCTDFVSRKLKAARNDRFQSEEASAVSVKFPVAALILTLVIAVLPIPVLAKRFLCIIPIFAAAFDFLPSLFSSFKNLSFYNINFIVFVIAVLCLFIANPVYGPLTVILYQFSEYIYAYLVIRHKAMATDLAALPVEARVYSEELSEKVSVKDVEINTRIIVKKGEIIPLDGIIVSGTATVDRSLVAASASAQVNVNDKVYRGDINNGSDIIIRVTETVENCAICVLNKNNLKPEGVHAAYIKNSAILRAIASILGIVLLIVSFFFNVYAERIQGIALLVLASSYTAGRAIELMYISALYEMRSKGVFVNNEKALNGCAFIDVVAFNKTGLLTGSNLTIDNVKTYNISEDALLKIAAAAECNCCHPVASSLRRVCPPEFLAGSARIVEEFPGMGVSSMIGSTHVLIGSSRLMAEKGVPVPLPENTGITVFVALNNAYAGRIHFTESIRASAPDVIESVRAYGTSQVVMLTGSSATSARQIANTLTFDMIKCEMLPSQKLKTLDYLKENKKIGSSLVYIHRQANKAYPGDHCDVSIAVDAYASDADIINTDVVSVSSELDFIDRLFSFSGKLKTMFSHVFLAILASIVLLAVLTAFGLLHSGVAVCIYFVMCMAASLYTITL